jgi:hypothetical protein
MAEAKTRPTRSSVAGFLAKVGDPTRRADCRTVADMMEKATGEAPTMWGTDIVGFGRYDQKYANGRSAEWPIIAFSPRKTDLTLYIMPGLLDDFPELAAKLGKFKTGKTCLYLKRLSDVDTKVLDQVIRKSVEAMEPQRSRS